VEGGSIEKDGYDGYNEEGKKDCLSERMDSDGQAVEDYGE
jgi:hypothetical protein